MAPSNSFRCLVNYICGLDEYRLSIQNITLVLDNEKMSFINDKFNFSISYDRIATIQFMKSPFKMPAPLSPVNLNFAYTCFRIYYFDDNYPKSILFMVKKSATDSFENTEETCRKLFFKLSTNCYDNIRIISPWGENKYNSHRLKIKKIYLMSYLGGHPENRRKFSRVDFYILNDSFYVDGYINENKFSAFEIPFNRIKLFELTNQKQLSFVERIFSLGIKTDKCDTVHIIFTNTKNMDVSVYFSILQGTTAQEGLGALEELFNNDNTD